MGKNSFTDLEVWQIGYEITLTSYRLTANFPKNELFGLVSQLRRSSCSIPANIAEGYGRKSPKELVHFLHISLGSLEETRCHLLLSRDLKYIRPGDFEVLNELCEKFTAKTLSFIRYLKTKENG